MLLLHVLLAVLTQSALSAAQPTTSPGTPIAAPITTSTARQSTDPASLEHLPAAVRSDIERWRTRLMSAACLKVVCDTDETWTNLHELSERGTPRRVHHERFQTHSWMTADSLWVVIFPFSDGVIDTSRPVLQMYWNKQQKKLWRRIWNQNTAAYAVSSTPCDEPYGPTTPGLDCRGCIYAATTESWLAGGNDFAERTISLSSIALRRRPNIAIVPPTQDAAGIWLDVFKDSVARNEDTQPGSLYRRGDYMLLARNDAGEPEVREWRTIVMTDPSESGKKPQIITGIRRFAYTVHDSLPQQVVTASRAFVDELDRSIAR